MPTDTESRPYSAIIRTFCSFPQVEEVVRSLRAQSLPPREIIVVDSGSPDDERSRLRWLADTFIDFPPEPFNFSKALNLGVDAATTPSCLMISSHFVLDDATLIDACIRETEARGMSVFYISNARRKRARKYTVVSAATFDGFNGFSNACGFVPTAFVRERRFREDVFACEDQEWAAWYFRERRGSILKVGSPSIRYLNPRINVEKKINEELAIACFVDRRRLSPRYVAWRIARAWFFTVTGSLTRAACERRVARELWRARRQTPRKPSRYF
jgi:glycosyltransferase involved in cell wall biosynthesis